LSNFTLIKQSKTFEEGKFKKQSITYDYPINANNDTLKYLKYSKFAEAVNVLTNSNSPSDTELVDTTTTLFWLETNTGLLHKSIDNFLPEKDYIIIQYEMDSSDFDYIKDGINFVTLDDVYKKTILKSRKKISKSEWELNYSYLLKPLTMPTITFQTISNGTVNVKISRSEETKTNIIGFYSLIDITSNTTEKKFFEHKEDSDYEFKVEFDVLKFFYLRISVFQTKEGFLDSGYNDFSYPLFDEIQSKSFPNYSFLTQKQNNVKETGCFQMSASKEIKNILKLSNLKKDFEYYINVKKGWVNDYPSNSKVSSNVLNSGSNSWYKFKSKGENTETKKLIYDSSYKFNQEYSETFYICVKDSNDKFFNDMLEIPVFVNTDFNPAFEVQFSDYDDTSLNPKIEIKDGWYLYNKIDDKLTGFDKYKITPDKKIFFYINDNDLNDDNKKDFIEYQMESKLGTFIQLTKNKFLFCFGVMEGLDTIVVTKTQFKLSTHKTDNLINSSSKYFFYNQIQMPEIPKLKNFPIIFTLPDLTFEHTALGSQIIAGVVKMIGTQPITIFPETKFETAQTNYEKATKIVFSIETNYLSYPHLNESFVEFDNVAEDKIIGSKYITLEFFDSSTPSSSPLQSFTTKNLPTYEGEFELKNTNKWLIKDVKLNLNNINFKFKIYPFKSNDPSDLVITAKLVCYDDKDIICGKYEYKFHIFYNFWRWTPPQWDPILIPLNNIDIKSAYNSSKTLKLTNKDDNSEINIPVISSNTGMLIIDYNLDNEITLNEIIGGITNEAFDDLKTLEEVFGDNNKEITKSDSLFRFLKLLIFSSDNQSSYSFKSLDDLGITSIDLRYKDTSDNQSFILEKNNKMSVTVANKFNVTIQGKSVSAYEVHYSETPSNN